MAPKQVSWAQGTRTPSKTSSLSPHQPFQLEKGLTLAFLTYKCAENCFFSSYQPLSLHLKPHKHSKRCVFALFIPICIIDPFTFYLGLFSNTVSIFGLLLALLMTWKLFLGLFSRSAEPFKSFGSYLCCCYLYTLYAYFSLLYTLLIIFLATPSILKACKFHIFIK